MWNLIVSILVANLVATTSVACASPCDGVDRSLSKERSSKLAPVIAKQLHVASVDVLQSFGVGSWSVILVDTHESDEPFLLYAADPLGSQYITLWSGAATSDEEQRIMEWVIKNAPGIPLPLASCFARHVTKSRDL